MWRIDTIVYINAIIVEPEIVSAVARSERPAATCPILQCLHRLISAGNVELRMPAIDEAFGDGASPSVALQLLRSDERCIALQCECRPRIAASQVSERQRGRSGALRAGSARISANVRQI